MNRFAVHCEADADIRAPSNRIVTNVNVMLNRKVGIDAAESRDGEPDGSSALGGIGNYE